jgi:AraC family transcriptional regulator, regulatory protein of adaptative response / methylated-DNA-[protein]-cysteine methyltransferase
MQAVKEIILMDFNLFWQSVLDRDASMDGRFVFAVQTTGVYCRPSCAARRPQRGNVVFFDAPADAERAGFRACRRCKPNQNVESHRSLAERARKIIDENSDDLEKLSLSILADELNVSTFQIHRAFKKTFGLTPRQYSESRRLARFKQNVRHGNTVTNAIYEAGYGSSSRLYEKSSARLGMTPASYQRGGKGATIHYSIAPCELGLLLTASTERGLCAVRFGDNEQKLVAELTKEFPKAELINDKKSKWTIVVNNAIHGEKRKEELPLDIQASAFEWKVWNYLRSLSAGVTNTYGEVAKAIGQPTASRAVARACAANPVAVVIPCHRVVPAAGGVGGYRWGSKRKEQILRLETGKR